MAVHNKTILLLASKLGLQEDEKVIRKAAEFDRLLQTKSVASNVITDTCKVVICLDLAASLFGSDIDMKTAIKYSGLKPSTYTNSKKTVENLLEINNDKLSIPSLCLTLQCNGVQELAEKILAEYKKQSKLDIDLSLPHNICMAVFQACRINKVKSVKSKIMEKSRLKPAQWSKLEAEWAEMVDGKFISTKKKKLKDLKSTEDLGKEIIENMDIDEKNDDIISVVHQIESYNDWKKRMLDEAYAEIKEQQTISKEKFTRADSLTPRRSPRKTPQKFAPYISPDKKKGVRLLFPL